MEPDPDNSLVMETIDDCIMSVRASTDITDEAKDGLVGQLRAARHAINGAPDKVQALAELVAIRTVSEAKQALLLPITVKAQAKACVDAHVAACAGAKIGPQVDPNSKLGIFLACIQSWPLAIVAVTALVAPNAAPIIDRLTAFFK